MKSIFHFTLKGLVLFYSSSEHYSTWQRSAKEIPPQHIYPSVCRLINTSVLLPAKVGALLTPLLTRKKSKCSREEASENFVFEFGLNEKCVK